MVAVAGVEDDQVTELVRFCVLESLYVPVAVYCCVAPTTMDAFAGVTAIDVSVGPLALSTVRLAVAVCVSVPLVPVIVSVKGPVGVVAAVWTVSVERSRSRNRRGIERSGGSSRQPAHG